MSIAWGTFEDIAVHYLRELAKRSEQPTVFFCKIDEPVYGVGYLWEFASMVEMRENGKYRLISATTADEFMGLLFARFLDFCKEEEDGTKKKDISTGELFGSESAAVDAGGDQRSEGGRGKDTGGK